LPLRGPSKTVLAGLDPAIQPVRQIFWIHQAFLDRRVKPGDDIFVWI
jgi:hypothetical protein